MADKSFIEPKRLAPNTYLVGGGKAVLQFAALPGEATNDVGKITPFTPPDGGESVDVAFWGKQNDLPFYREELIAGNNIVPALIERKRNILLGQGWYAYKERYEDDDDGMMKRVVDEVPMDMDMEAFFKKFKKEAARLVGDWLKHSMCMPEFVRGLGDKIVSVKALEIKYCRAAKKNAMGDIPRWYWCNYWQRKNSIKEADRLLQTLTIYDPASKKKQPKFVLPLMDDLFNDCYYPIPAYWGGRHWITLSNIIPLFHEANLKHGSAPRFHIIIPHDYFWDYAAMNATTEGSEDYQKVLKTAEEKEKQFVIDFNSVLVGVGNTGRPIVTKSEIIEALGGKYEKRIQIEKIDYNINDEALLKLYAASNVANVSAQALHPTLASIETGGKGIGSGTEIRNAFLLYLIIAAPVVRDMLMEVVEVVKTENGWPADVKFGIRDAEMTTLAENPSGMQAKEPNDAVQ
jgi:hypothetical protein